MTDNPLSPSNPVNSQSQPDCIDTNQVASPSTHHHHNDFSNRTYVPINNAGTVNIPPPAIPANDMVLLEHNYPGAIDRILKMSEAEQAFTHQIVQQQHSEQIKIQNRNIEISKEQNLFNIIKLFMGFFVIVGLTAIDTYLFYLGFNIGGGIMTFATLVLAAIFILGYFPESIFSIFRRGNPPAE